MAFFDRIFKRRVPATAEQIGEVLYVAAIKNGQDLAHALLETGAATEHRDRLETTECNVELLTFAMFPLDLIANDQFGPDAQAIRTAMRSDAGALPKRGVVSLFFGQASCVDKRPVCGVR
jgi:hypothetical protein